MSVPTSPTEASHLARVRENQRRSRARRKEYVQELERRLRSCELQGVEASTEVQLAARKVADENKRLRTLLHKHGINDYSIDAYLKSGAIILPGESPLASPTQCSLSGDDLQTLETLLGRRRPFRLAENASYPTEPLDWSIPQACEESARNVRQSSVHGKTTQSTSKAKALAPIPWASQSSIESLTARQQRHVSTVASGFNAAESPSVIHDRASVVDQSPSQEPRFTSPNAQDSDHVDQFDFDVSRQLQSQSHYQHAPAHQNGTPSHFLSPPLTRTQPQFARVGTANDCPEDINMISPGNPSNRLGIRSSPDPGLPAGMVFGGQEF